MGKVILSGRAPKLVEPEITVPALTECTPAEIQAVAQSGKAANYWAVGDRLSIVLNGTVGLLTFSSEIYYAFILGFDHNSNVEGNNTIHFQVGKTSAGVAIAFIDSDYGNTNILGKAGFRMNNTHNSNIDGWESSYMRQTICPAFLSAMPSAWQNVITSCTKYSDNTGGGSNTASYVTSTSDKVFLLAEFELFGSRSYANNAEQSYQKQYDYYKAGNSKIKYQHNATTSACPWWLRSTRATELGNFCCVTTGGLASVNTPSGSYGFAPAFVVA